MILKKMSSSSRGLAVVLLLISTLCFSMDTLRAQEPSEGAGIEEVPARGVPYVAKEFFVPVPNSFPHGLDVVELYANFPGKHPLAVLTHGTSDKVEDRQRVTPWAQFGQALWFARRGYVVLVVTRKGYGRSGGQRDDTVGGCRNQGSFRESGEASANDLRAIIQWAANQPEMDADTVVSAGVSTGGFAQVALSANPPRGLKAAISFAGGRGGDGKEHNCNLDNLVNAFRDFGKNASKHGSLPMLWIYSENDHWFTPAMAARFEEAYQKAGGSDQFVLTPPDGQDGHHFYYHIDAWSKMVSAFLQTHDLLPLHEEVLPPPTAPDDPAPSLLHDRGANAWKHYLAAAPYKAFAVSDKGNWGLSSAAFDQSIADEVAIDRCKKAVQESGNKCRIVAQTPGTK